MADAIVIEGLTKRFGRLTAVEALSLRVASGSVHGFLGLNGAGKTTTIRLLLGLLRPSGGRAFVLGHDCQRAGLLARARVGYLPAELGFYADMTGREVLRVCARLSGAGVTATRQSSLLDRLRLGRGDLARRVGEYSTGMRRKLGLVLAFQGDPALLILDEPTEGLDPLMQGVLHTMLAECRGEGRTVFLSSHVLAEVDRVCDRVAVLRNGRLVLDASVEEVRALAPRRVRIAFSGEVPAPVRLPDGVRVLAVGPSEWELEATAAIGALVQFVGRLPVADLEVSERRLEDVVIGYYREPAS